jgi:hypothetical protein
VHEIDEPARPADESHPHLGADLLPVSHRLLEPLPGGLALPLQLGQGALALANPAAQARWSSQSNGRNNGHPGMPSRAAAIGNRACEIRNNEKVSFSQAWSRAAEEIAG